MQAVKRAGDIRGIKDRRWRTADGLGVEPGHPPVVFTRRVGSDIGERFGVWRPVELVDVEVGGSSERGRCGLGRIGGNCGDALDFDIGFADDAGGQILGGECPCRASRSFHIEESNAFSIRGKGGRIYISVQLGEPARGTAVEAGDVKVALSAGIGAIGKERDSARIRRPDKVRFATRLPLRGGSDRLALGEVVNGRDLQLAALRPRKAFAVRRDRNLANGSAVTQAGEDFVDARRGGRDDGVLSSRGQNGGCAKDKHQGGKAEATKHERHRENANSSKRRAAGEGLAVSATDSGGPALCVVHCGSRKIAARGGGEWVDAGQPRRWRHFWF